MELEILLKNLQQLKPQIMAVQSGIKKLESYSMEDKRDDKFDAPALEIATSLATSIDKIQQEAVRALLEVCIPQGTTKEEITAMGNEQLSAKEPQRQFCGRAKSFQSGDKDNSILSSEVMASKFKSDWGYICKTCGLEVGYYPAVRFSSAGHAVDTFLLLTASHLNACKWKDRRAFYRCLACYRNRKIVDFPSAIAFEKHMEIHPDFTMMGKKEEDQAVTLLAKEEDRAIALLAEKEDQTVAMLTEKEEEFFQSVESAIEIDDDLTSNDPHDNQGANASASKPSPVLAQVHFSKESQQNMDQPPKSPGDVSSIDEEKFGESVFGDKLRWMGGGKRTNPTKTRK